MLVLSILSINLLIGSQNKDKTKGVLVLVVRHATLILEF